MPKRKKGKNKSEEDKKKEMNTLAVGKYTEKFESLPKGEKRALKDSRSDKNSSSSSCELGWWMERYAANLL